MKFFRYLFLARRTLLEHKLRSFLTVLGIIFGVAAVIAMTAIGEGGKEEALRQISQMGIQNIFIHDRAAARRAAAEKGKYITDGLRDADLELIGRCIPAVVERAAIRETALFVQTDGFRGNRPVRGVDPQLFAILAHPLASGRALTDLDARENQKVCALGAAAAERLFQNARAVGNRVRIRGQGFTVVGVFDPHPGYDEDIYIPRTAPVLYEQVDWFAAPITTALLHIPDVPLIPAAASLVDRLLLRRHLDVPDYELVIPEALFRQQERTRNIFNSIMVLITGISLLVGGIGIMNIMLASVLERTREIGIRRGVGATRNDIESQFLAEAVLLTAAGGIIGIAVGLALTWAIGVFTGWQTRIPPLAVLIAFSFSVLIGVVFGYYPARNAGRLDPIDALRYE